MGRAVPLGVVGDLEGVAAKQNRPVHPDVVVGPRSDIGGHFPHQGPGCGLDPRGDALGGDTGNDGVRGRPEQRRADLHLFLEGVGRRDVGGPVAKLIELRAHTSDGERDVARVRLCPDALRPVVAGSLVPKVVDDLVEGRRYVDVRVGPPTPPVRPCPGRMVGGADKGHETGL